MKIYEFEAFPNPARVRIALNEKNLSHRAEFVPVDLPGGEHKEPEFLAKNPSGTVPVLELDDGTTISECTAISEYIDHLAGESTLTRRSPKERAVIHMMQRRAEVGLLDAVGAYFHHATPGLGPEIEGYQFADWGNHQRERSVDGMRCLDRVLAERPCIAGDAFSMADITAFAGPTVADFAEVSIPADYNRLKSWRARVGERPSVRI